MNRNNFIWFAIMSLFFSCLILNAYAFDYHAPIETEKQLIIFGETPTITCSLYSGLCNYKYSITNQDSLSHTVNIGAYLNSTLATAIITKEITYESRRIDYNYCLEYGEVPDDKNGEKSTQCIKSEIRTTDEQTLTYGTPIKNETFDAQTKGFTTTATSVRTPTTTSITQLNQTTLLPSETKYFLITFKPVKKTGELILVAKSDSNFSITGSLDPTWGFSLVDDFEDNDYTNNPTWILSIGGGASVSTTTAYSPTHSLKITNVGNRVTTTLAGLPADNNYTTWLYPTGGELLFGVEKDTNVWSQGAFRTGYNGGTLQTSICDTANKNSGISMPPNVWYKLTIHYAVGDANAFYYLQDVNGAYRGSYTHLMGACSFTPGTVELYMNTAEGYFDDVTYGGTVVSTKTIDFNVYIKNTTTHLSNYNIDCNTGSYDGNYSSPNAIAMITDSYACKFNRTGYDTNGNGTTTYPIIADANKTYVIYLTDSTAPVLGTTTLSGFTINGSYIKGIGNIQTTISDAGSGVDTTQCEYTINNGASWLAADGNATHCYKNNLTITSGVTYDFNFRGKDLAGNQGQATKSSTYIGRTAGTLLLNIKDENTNSTLNTVAINFGGYSTTINSGSTIDLNFLSSTTTNYTIAFTKTSYGTRYYQFDGNANMPDFNINFLLLPTTLGNNIAFKFYDTDKTTPINAQYVTMFNPILSNWLIGRQKTSSTGQATFNINTSTDQNYTQQITRNSGVDYNQPAITLTVLQPLDQILLTAITIPWRIDLAVNQVSSYLNLSSQKNLILLANTLQAYTVTIQDNNQVTYYPQNYSQQFYTTDSTSTLQPYLLSKTVAPLNYIRTQSLYTLLPIADITIKVYTTVLGVNTLTSTLVTDSSGSASIAMIANQTYTWEVYQNGVLLSTETIVAPNVSGTTFYINISDTTGTIQPLGNFFLDINFSPTNLKLHKYDSSLTQRVSLTDFNSGITISNITITVTNTDVNGIIGNNAVLYTSSFASPTLPFTNSIPIDYTINSLNGQKYDQNSSLIVKVLITTSIGQTQQSMTYKPVNGLDFLQVISFDIRPMFGCSATNNGLIPCAPLLLAALFISMVAAVVVAAGSGYISMTSIGGLFLFIMGIFTYISWVPYLIFGIMFVGTIGLMIAEGGRRI